MANGGNGAFEGQWNESITAVSANYTALITDQNIFVTTGASPANIVVTLPAPAPAGTFNSSSPVSGVTGVGNAGQRIFIQKVDSANGTLTVAGKFPFGSSTTLTAQGKGLTVVSDGTNWNSVGSVS
jgi:hypothetical protein